ncbi:pyridoxal 5'-phosphate synthase glutaminase subunit PdxT [Corynebacterium sp. 3HC-13]|uniref:pyridoxal 5'-phosphate synthase glutaminase subunit PdxT n=1 Tax=Corynebacterium poyangense TaxID=2684405 RepID=UPI001CCCD5C4|nr:pyridoxal 5'-phosphate synthase glutaminase subunit PdxT [Corynebacterium poyangense]MBZ8177901.1 pyridoxal 5'-phosphate synthase glutaminase subunit PdxT [Corynebacterium poyangense]
MSSRVGILALQGGVAEHQRSLNSLGVEPVLVRRREHLEDLSALILPGGESTTICKLLDLGGLLVPLGNLIRSGLPTYGTCAGMILLAKDVLNTRPDARGFAALDITVQRNAFGRQADSFECVLDFEGESLPAVFIRAPRVVSCGDNVRVLAQVPEDEEIPPSHRGAMVAVEQDNLLATSFHPEVTASTYIHRYFLKKAGISVASEVIAH